MSGLRIPELPRQRQDLASRPRASAWVSANAGSGKTFVLSRRVVRLLLDGTDPGRILPARLKRPAASRSRPFTAFARPCCISFRLRPTWRGISPCLMIASRLN